MIYAIDIETAQNEEAIKWLPDVEPASRLKDPEKIKANIEAKKQEQIDKMALTPEFGKIACIGIWGEEKQEVLVGEEKEILKNFFSFLKGVLVQNADIVTYNGKGFDFDFIFKRAIFHELAKLHDMKAWTDKFKAYHHIDLMTEYCKYGQFLKLDLLAEIYLGEKKIDFDVKQIPELLKTEEGIEKLKEYCLKDCELTYRLAKKFGY
jgi:DNA polymerase elongation subunit (family B)